MRVYNEQKLSQVYCNKCGKNIKVKNGIIEEGVLSVDYKWGYFSNKDGKQHSFDLCEECYDEMIKLFDLPVTEKEYTELL